MFETRYGSLYFSCIVLKDYESRFDFQFFAQQSISEIAFNALFGKKRKELINNVDSLVRVASIKVQLAPEVS